MPFFTCYLSAYLPDLLVNLSYINCKSTLFKTTFEISIWDTLRNISLLKTTFEIPLSLIKVVYEQTNANKFSFGSNFISWIKLLLNSTQSCVINADNTTQLL